MQEREQRALGYWRSGVKGIQKGSFPNVGNLFLRRLCNHCDTAPCTQVCPVQATVRREEDGVVVMYYGKCIGCGMCISACPYDARFFNPIRHTADKCDFCATRIDSGLQPACVEACISRALVFGDMDDPESEISKKLASIATSVIKPELGTYPKVFYIQADHSLQGRIKYSENFKEAIEEYHKHIPSPEASSGKKGKKGKWKLPFYITCLMRSLEGIHSALFYILRVCPRVRSYFLRCQQSFGIKRFKPMALPAAIISFVLLLLAPACLILDLHQPLRFWHTLVPEYFNKTSALSYGSWLLSAYPIANLVYIYFIFIKNDRVTKILGTITVPLAIFVQLTQGLRSP